MFPETVRTESLSLERLSPSNVDVFELYDLFADGSDTASGVFEYVPMEGFSTPNDAREWLVGAETEWEDGDHAKYAVFEEGTTLAGTAALSPEWERRRASLAVILARPYWGRGYAGECARALAGVAFENLDLEVVTLGYDEGNERSRRAIEKVVDRLGGGHDGVRRNETPRDGEVVDAHVYSVDRSQYRRATGDE